MKHNGRELRVVQINGKYSVRMCKVDEDDYVVSVPHEIIGLEAYSIIELRQLLQEAGMNITKGVTVVQGGNSKELMENG